MLIGVAWFIWLVGFGRAWFLPETVGRVDDVVDSLGRAGSVARHVVVFDGLALAVVVAAELVLVTTEIERLRWWLLAFLLWVPSTAVLGLSFLLSLIMSG